MNKKINGVVVLYTEEDRERVISEWSKKFWEKIASDFLKSEKSIGKLNA